MKKNLLILTCVSALLFGCASQSAKQRALEALAENRANFLSTQLPINSGPLSIMKISSKGPTIEMMMIYDQDAQGTKPIQELYQSSINRFCNDEETKNNLDMGILYRIKIHNSRGQLLIDEVITQQTCSHSVTP